MAAKKNTETNPIKELGKTLQDFMTDFFGECIDNDGVLRARLTNMGVINTQVIVDIMLEEGIREDAPYGVLHFHHTLAQNIPEEALATLLISLNNLNHVINAGPFPGFGCFAYYEPLNQVYLSYRMPVNLNQIEAEYDNIRYYLGTLYEQLDLFVDFIMFAASGPEAMDISDYMDYLDEVADLNDFQARLDSYEELLTKVMEDNGINIDDLVNENEGEEEEDEEEEENQ